MKKLLLVLIFVILISSVLAVCKEEQIDINSASIEELDKIVYIGPTRAEQIIALRPFSSVDDLIRISGIGETYLNSIKEQNLACVNGTQKEKDEEEGESEEEEPPEQENDEEEEEDTKEIIKVVGRTSKNPENQSKEEIEPITLNPQNIKTETNSGEVSKNYAVYSFIAFSVLLALLFLMKRRKYENEFT